MAEMMQSAAREKILIAVKTYPQPSNKYRETVCTAGITEKGKWIRLYPIQFRNLPRIMQYSKYQWISVQLRDQASNNDPRLESRRPIMDSLRLEGECLPPNRNWADRRAIIDPLPHRTIKQLREDYEQYKTSLGIVRPTRVLGIEIERENEDWNPRLKRVLNQIPLLTEDKKPLRKIPFKFTYIFECEDSIKPHRAMITDWELGMLYLRQEATLGPDDAAESVRYKFLSQLCSADLDTRFFMGTRFPYNSWMVLGVFYPKKSPPQWRNQPLF